MTPFRRAHGAALVFAASVLALIAFPRSASAADVGALIAQSEHDTNTVKTLVHHDTTVRTAPTAVITISSRGAEDEVANREHDFESVTVKTQAAGKAPRTVHYTADIVFLNKTVYYLTSLAPKKWYSRAGTTFPDPYSGGWKRARTTVTFPAGVKFQSAGTSGGDTVVQSAAFAIPGGKETARLWISGGSTPYVVREVVEARASKGGVTFHQDTRFGPFNSKLIILAPAKGGTT